MGKTRFELILVEHHVGSVGSGFLGYPHSPGERALLLRVEVEQRNRSIVRRGTPSNARLGNGRIRDCAPPNASDAVIQTSSPLSTRESLVP
jgi:hypothetical protein